MKVRYKNVSIFLISFSFLILFIYFSINYLIKKPSEIINFIESDINIDFEIEITNNLNDINNYLKEYLFIKSHLLKRKDNEINIKIILKEPFARNYLTKEVIFYDNTKAPFNFFKSNFLDKINLIDISKKSIHINNYLNDNYQNLSSLFDIEAWDNKSANFLASFDLEPTIIW